MCVSLFVCMNLALASHAGHTSACSSMLPGTESRFTSKFVHEDWLESRLFGKSSHIAVKTEPGLRNSPIGQQR